MHILVIKLIEDGREMRFVSSRKTFIKRYLEIKAYNDGPLPDYHYRWWKDGWAESSEDAWKHIHNVEGMAQIILFA